MDELCVAQYEAPLHIRYSATSFISKSNDFTSLVGCVLRAKATLKLRPAVNVDFERSEQHSPAFAACVWN